MKAVVSLAALALLTVAPVSAATPDQSLCLSRAKVNAEERVSACSDLILSGYRQPIAYVARGRARLALGDYDRAIADFTTALKADPAYADALSGRGQAYANKGATDKAIADFDKALSVRPTARDFARRGHAYLTDQWPNYKHAVADFSASLEIKPDSAEALNNRCWARALWQRDLELALNDCDLALQIDARYVHARDSRGLVYFHLGRLDEALNDYDDVLRYSPDAASSLYMRGIVKLKKKDGSGYADIARAKKLDPEIARTYARYGVRP